STNERGAATHEADQELMVLTPQPRQVLDESHLLTGDRQTVLVKFDPPEIEPERLDRIRNGTPDSIEFGGSLRPLALAVPGDERCFVTGRGGAHLRCAVNDWNVDQSCHHAVCSVHKRRVTAGRYVF